MEFGGIAARRCGTCSARAGTNVLHAKELGFSVSVLGLIIVSCMLFGKRVVVGGVKKIASLTAVRRARMHV